MKNSFTLCLTFAFLCAGCTSDSPAGGDSALVEEGFVTAQDGVRLFYRKVGTGASTVIVPGDLFLFDDFKQLADGRTLIFYDMRNRGRSDSVAEGDRLTIHHDVTDLEAVRAHFSVEKTSLVGYSYLGLMVAMYALEHPERVERIVQMGPVPRKFGTEYPEHLTNNDLDSVLDQEEVQRLRQLRADGFHESNPKEYCEQEWSVMRFHLVGDPANVDKLGAGWCEMPNEWPVNLDRHFQHNFVSVQQLDIPKETIAGISVPVLTIHGTKDRNAPYGGGREWAVTLPNARLLTVEGVAHQSWLEAPEIILPAIDEFLRGEWPAAAEKVTVLDNQAGQ